MKFKVIVIINDQEYGYGTFKEEERARAIANLVTKADGYEAKVITVNA